MWTIIPCHNYRLGLFTNEHAHIFECIHARLASSSSLHSLVIIYIINCTNHASNTINTCSIRILVAYSNMNISVVSKDFLNTSSELCERESNAFTSLMLHLPFLIFSKTLNVYIGTQTFWKEARSKRNKQILVAEESILSQVSTRWFLSYNTILVKCIVRPISNLY